MKPKYSAFTMRATGIRKQLLSEVLIAYNNQVIKVKALWDTGATGTCISQEVAEKLDMIPTGKSAIRTPSGEKIVNTYVLNIILPNNVLVNKIRVNDSDIGKQGFDMLIGMDVICNGDFAVSNHNGKTTFSFVVPSMEEVDFVSKANVFYEEKNENIDEP